MERGKSHDKDAHRELDVLLSRLNALEASSSDKYQKSVIGIIRTLAENQKHFVDEFEHLKKAIDLLTLQLFRVEHKKNS